MQAGVGGSGSTLTVGDDGVYPTIGDAVIAASVGDTILVHSGVYSEQPLIDKRLTVEGVDTGGGKPVIDGMGLGDVVNITGDGVRLANFVVRNASEDAAGILVSADGDVITGNEVAGCGEGIRLDHARDSTVEANDLHDNGDAGICISGANDSRIAGNHASDNLYGVYMEYASGNVIEDNNCSNNIDIEIYMENVSDCTVRDNWAVSERIRDKKIDGIGMRYGTSVVFDGNYVGQHYYGIKVYNSSGCLVEDNVADGSGVNIRLDFGTHDTTLRNNTVRNGVDNIYVHSSAYDNLIEGNRCYNGREGIYLLECPGGNVLRGNEAYNDTIGIRLVSTTGNTVTGNHVHDNVEDIDCDTDGNTINNNDS